MTIRPIKALSDNYIWLIEKESRVIVVDPGEAEGVLQDLKDNALTLEAIILTHNHHDHTGGVKKIVSEFPGTPVYGPKETEDVADHLVEDGDTIDLLGEQFEVFLTAGHTHGHISYLMGEALFCGDALFSGGCGRVFTGDYQAQFDALQKFKALDDKVLVYAAHEYTQTNLRFANEIEPSNAILEEALKEADERLIENQPTLPSNIGKEKEINLFLRAETLEDFIGFRQARDDF